MPPRAPTARSRTQHNTRSSRQHAPRSAASHSSQTSASTPAAGQYGVYNPQSPCPACKATTIDLLNHIRTSGIHGQNGILLEENHIQQLGLTRCQVCRWVLHPNGLARHRCPGPPQPPAIPGSSTSTSTSSPTTAGPSQPPPAPLAPAAGGPAAAPPHHATIPSASSAADAQGPNPLSSDWVNEVPLEWLAKCHSPDHVPSALSQQWYAALDRVCGRMIEDRYSEPSVKAFLLLPKVGMCKWLGKEARRNTKRVLRDYPLLPDDLADKLLSGSLPAPPEHNPDPDAARARAVKRLMLQGHLRKAARCLLSDGVLRLNEEGLHTLRSLHPAPLDDSPPFSGQVPHPSLDCFTAELLQSTVRKLPGDSAAGPSGWTFHMVRESWDSVPKFRDALEGLGMLMIRGGGDFPARDWLCASRLVPIKKKPSGVRPIACGESITRVICRWALSAISPDAVLLPQQFGVGSPGGVEPVVWSAADVISSPGCHGLLSIDFSNAFNTVSRHRIAEAVRTHLPVLFSLVKLLYHEPSPLLVRHEDGVETMHSATGVRQGDPLGPLLFSLAITPLVKRIKEEWAVDQHVWAYLDDIFLEVRDQSAAESLVEHLGSEDVQRAYGLRVNAAKCKFVPGSVLREVGCSVLGSWIGGPDTADNQGAELGVSQADKLRARVPSLDILPLQQRLILLRFCYFPCIVHLIRSQHPDVSAAGASSFDLAIEEALVRWVGPLSTSATTIVHLPTRLGGLGMFSQAALRHVAAGASFVLSHGFLNERGIPLSTLQVSRMEAYVKVCADNLNLQPDSLLNDEEWKQPHLQRRASEVIHERNWKQLFENSSSESRRRLLESCMPLARAWLHTLPTCGALQLRDVDTRYALHRTLLFSLHSEPGNAVCPGCFRPHDALHHLSCAKTQKMTKVRHNAVRRTVAAVLRRTGERVEEERTCGQLIHDITISNNELGRTFIDIGITATSAGPVGPVAWPTNSEVELEIAAEAARPARDPEFPWDTHQQELHHPDSNHTRVYRKLATRKAVAKAMDDMAARKTSHFNRSYAPAPNTPRSQFVPFILTACGAINDKARDLLRSALQSIDHPGKRSRYKKFCFGRLSIILIKYAAAMASTLNDLSVRNRTNGNALA